MNFDLTDEQRRWRDLARDFAQGEIRPRASQLDKEQKFPYDIVAEMTELGLMGMTVPEEYGGSDGDFVTYNLALEEISRADTSVGITMEAHISLGCSPLVGFGTREQKEHFLGEVIAGGKRLWAFGLTEEEAGTDAGGTRTTAELEDGEWVINGSKKWITNGGTDITGGVTAIARTGTRENDRPELTAIIIPQDTPGYTRGPGYEDRLARLRPATALFRGLPRAGGERARRAWGRFEAVFADARRREGRGRGALGRAGAGLLRRGAKARQAAPTVRAFHRRIPGHPVQAGGHGYGDRSGTEPRPQGGLAQGSGARFRAGGKYGEGVRLGDGQEGGGSGGPDPRRRGLHGDERRHALLAAGEDQRDRRRD